jgi:hypothetical protein
VQRLDAEIDTVPTHDARPGCVISAAVLDIIVTMGHGDAPSFTARDEALQRVHGGRDVEEGSRCRIGMASPRPTQARPEISQDFRTGVTTKSHLSVNHTSLLATLSAHRPRCGGAIANGGVCRHTQSRRRDRRAGEREP